MRLAGYQAYDLKEGGYSAGELREAGFEDSEQLSAHLTTLSSWLLQRMTLSLGDPAAAEALAIGAEVLLAFDEDSVMDRVAQVVEMLREQDVEEAVLDEFVNEVSRSGVVAI